MAKKSGHGYSFSDLSHGKKAGDGTQMHFKHIGGKGSKSGAKVEGHVDPNVMMHDAKGHDHGSRGPFTKASTGNSKSKN
jgi:hypothetical protein